MTQTSYSSLLFTVPDHYTPYKHFYVVQCHKTNNIHIHYRLNLAHTGNRWN